MQAHQLLPPDLMRILISGATGIIGRSLSENLVRQNPEVELILLGRSEDRLAILDDALKEIGARPPLLVPLDFTTATSAHVKELSQKIADAPLDGLVLGAAMHTGLHPLDHLKPVEFDKIIRVGVYAPFWLVHHLLPMLKESRRGGRVLGVSDDVGAQAKPFWGAYGMAKSSLDTLLEQLRHEAEGRVSVKRVCPPPVASPLRGLVYPGEDPRTLNSADEITLSWANWLVQTD